MTCQGADRRDLVAPKTGGSLPQLLDQTVQERAWSSEAVLSIAHPNDTPTVKTQLWFSEAMAACLPGLMSSSSVGGNYKNYEICRGDELGVRLEEDPHIFSTHLASRFPLPIPMATSNTAQLYANL